MLLTIILRHNVVVIINVIFIAFSIAIMNYEDLKQIINEHLRFS